MDQNGAPVSIIVSKGNVHDSKVLKDILDNFNIRSNGIKLSPQILTLDKAYDGKEIKSMLKKREISYRIPSKSNAINPERYAKLKPFRWTVERTFTWLNDFKAIKTYWEFYGKNYFALCKLACSIILIRMSLN